MIGRLLALLWLVVVIGAGLHVASSLRGGVPLQSDLLALLPAEDREPMVHEAKARMAAQLTRRVVVLIGHDDGAQARAAAADLRARLLAAGLIEDSDEVPSAQAQRDLAQVYFPHRGAVLSLADRQALLAGDVQGLAERTLSQVFGIGGMADARLLARDPFLLLPGFMTTLPVPASRLHLQDGWPSVDDNGRTWVLLSGRLRGQAYALDDQKAFVAGFDDALGALRQTSPDIAVLRLGAVFYAHAGATSAMAESSFIGMVSIIGTILLVLVVFRSGSPLVLSLTAIGTGLVVALSASLLVFGDLHVTAAIFGASLIGVTVDYSLHYFSRLFAGSTQPRARLAHVLPGLTLGLLTTLIGYGALALAPLPGLRQVAVFSCFGLVAAFITVVLWFPLLDRAKPRPLPAFLRRLALGLWALWQDAPLRPWRRGLMAVLLIAAGMGAFGLHADDDVRRQQALDPALALEQAEIQRLAGFTQAGQFFLVTAADDQAALELEERLGDALAPLRAEAKLADWRGLARFVPSVARQRENQRLSQQRLGGAVLAQLEQDIGLSMAVAPAADQPLTVAQVTATGAIPALADWRLHDGVHLVGLDGITDLAALRRLALSMDGVRFVDPVADMGGLLASYRQRALALLAVSLGLMLALLGWRYGLKGAIWVMVPPVAALVLTVPLLALVGLPFTFFAAMALVLVASVGVDYAVFCAESGGDRDPVTIIATLLATLTTLLSFGLLAFSGMAGMRSFGAVMLVGIALAALLAPLASRARPTRTCSW